MNAFCTLTQLNREENSVVYCEAVESMGAEGATALPDDCQATCMTNDVLEE